MSKLPRAKQRIFYDITASLGLVIIVLVSALITKSSTLQVTELFTCEIAKAQVCTTANDVPPPHKSAAIFYAPSNGPSSATSASSSPAVNTTSPSPSSQSPSPSPSCTTFSPYAPPCDETFPGPSEEPTPTDDSSPSEEPTPEESYPTDDPCYYFPEDPYCWWWYYPPTEEPTYEPPGDSSGWQPTEEPSTDPGDSSGWEWFWE